MTVASIEQVADGWLVEWSYWLRDDAWLGFPRRSVTETANEGGVSAGSPRPPTDMPDEVARTDRAVAATGLRNRSILRRVIYLRYERGLPPEGISCELDMSKSQVRATLGRAQRMVYRYRESF